ncbi:hypothetical protein ACLUWK_03935 [Bifidobacterium apri]|uniref:Uncharacterized protein n=2 Tax=Bifidobacterium apri TaxID=1769423 RepID=A0A6A2VTT1_9BIFI|nr:hypothetical protein DSM100238_1543 [Bifidobacterium apri]
MVWSPLAIMALALDAGYLVYAIAVPVIHYRMHDGGRWIFFSVLLFLLGVWTAYGTVASLLPQRPGVSLPLFRSFGELWVLYCFVGGSFRRFRNRGCFPDVARALMISAYAISAICLLLFMPGWWMTMRL